MNRLIQRLIATSVLVGGLIMGFHMRMSRL